MKFWIFVQTLRTKTYVLMTLIVLLGSTGNILLSRGMKQVGEVHAVSVPELAKLFLAVFTCGWMWLAIGLLAVGFFSLLTLLSWADVSLVIPSTAFSYVVGGLGAKFLLGEHLPATRWAGIMPVSISVALVCASY